MCSALVRKLVQLAVLQFRSNTVTPGGLEEH